MKILKYMYEKYTGKKAPYYYSYSLVTILMKPIRKFVVQVIAPNCPFNNLRVSIYRLCGFKIGKNTFIGMKCYLDDMCYDLIEIGNNVVISYGVYFACHGKNQGHFPIVIEDNAYIGMRATIITKHKFGGGAKTIIGKNAVVGSCALVNLDVPSGSVAVGIPCRIIKK
ncbi:acyltransferase [Anaerovibrio slackiae]|uniref:acyltransferase n=1 Tax=Anaerovibrio slackiae TaxID=2652309 RepID=UPI003863FC01